MLESFGQLVIIMCSFSHATDCSRMCRPCSCSRQRADSSSRWRNRYVHGHLDAVAEEPNDRPRIGCRRRYARTSSRRHLIRKRAKRRSWHSEFVGMPAPHEKPVSSFHPLRFMTVGALHAATKRFCGRCGKGRALRRFRNGTMAVRHARFVRSCSRFQRRSRGRACWSAL